MKNQKTEIQKAIDEYVRINEDISKHYDEIHELKKQHNDTIENSNIQSKIDGIRDSITNLQVEMYSVKQTIPDDKIPSTLDLMILEHEKSLREKTSI